MKTSPHSVGAMRLRARSNWASFVYPFWYFSSVDGWTLPMLPESSFPETILCDDLLVDPEEWLP